MSGGNPTTAATPAVDLETRDPVRIDCYTRRTVHPAVTDTITDLVRRVEGLAETDRVETVRVTSWPPGAHAVDRAADRSGAEPSTRSELVAEFERWAADADHSLEPAFRRREISLSPLGLGSGDAEPRERVRVPLVALAIREVETEALRGVVPYTERADSGESYTYTVDEWLSAVDPTEPDRPSTRIETDGPTPLEGRR